MWNIQRQRKCHKTQAKWISKPNDTNITEHMFKCSIIIAFLFIILLQIHFSFCPLLVSFDFVFCLYCNSGKRCKGILQVSVHVREHKGFVPKDEDMYPTEYSEHEAPRPPFQYSKITASTWNILHKYNYQNSIKSS